MGVSLAQIVEFNGSLQTNTIGSISTGMGPRHMFEELLRIAEHVDNTLPPQRKPIDFTVDSVLDWTVMLVIGIIILLVACLCTTVGVYYAWRQARKLAKASVSLSTLKDRAAENTHRAVVHPNLEFQGNYSRRTSSICIVSFPGIYEKVWDWMVKDKTLSL